MLGDMLTKKEYALIFTENDDEIAGVVHKIEKIQKMRNDMIENS